MADNISLKYTVLNTNPFAEAEPYLYGSGSPNAWYFLPIGDDNDAATTDFKVQLAESNGYSTVKYLEAFKINGNSIAYIEQGTFPVMRLIKSYASPYVASDHNTNTSSTTSVDENNGESDNHKAFCKLIITYDNATDKNIKTIQLNYYHLNKTTDPASSLLSDLDSTAASDSLTIYSRGDSADKDTIKFIKHNTERCPKRLGFILTGGGGGAGGISQLDPNKNKSGGDQYTTSGGGGGGGEVVYGVFNLTHPTWATTATQLIYTIYLGNGGKGGKHGSAGDTSHNNPQYGDNGSNGYDSIVWVATDTVAREELFRVCGGFGGSSGGLDTFGGAGSGGSYIGVNYSNMIRKANKNCILCAQISGGNGGTLANDVVSNKEFKHSLYFSNSIPPADQADYCLNLTYDALIGTNNSSTNRSSTNVPGGHSFGKGGTKDVNPTNGAGGCCNDSGGRDGAGGYFGLYY